MILTFFALLGIPHKKETKYVAASLCTCTKMTTKQYTHFLGCDQRLAKPENAKLSGHKAAVAIF